MAGVLFHLASKALEFLGKAVIQKVASGWGAQDELKKIENTIRMIQARVCDAENEQEKGSETIKDWLQRLRLVLYRADDLFDEIFTVDRQARRIEHRTMAKVGILCYRSDPFHYYRKLGDEIKSISKELEAIKFDMNGFNLRVRLNDELQLSMDSFDKKRKGTSFFTVEGILIGRENDRNLGGLDAENAWNLLKRFAFEPGQEGKESTFRHIGNEIIELCGNVPLAIKMIAGVLCSKDSKHEWLLIRDRLRLKAHLTEHEGIMHVLKLSYDYLPPELKQCFAYCSLFPKGYEFDKVKIVNLWMAQGFVEALDRGIGDHYFLELLKRNFFQDPCYDKHKKEVIRCEMHALVHDLADLVAGDESVKFGESSVFDWDQVVHFSVSLPDSEADVETDERELPPSMLAAWKMRTLLFVRSFTYTISCAIESSSLARAISRFKSLRALNLGNMGLGMIPDTIGGLRHLRYLNLEGNNIGYLPDATIRLDNLQTLNLFNCEFLEELPKDFAEFANLKNLVIDWISLTDLPLGFAKLTSLEELNEFVVGKGQNTGLDSLPAFNLRGELSIKFNIWHQNSVMEAQRAQLKDNHTLNCLILDMDFDFLEGGVPPAFDELNEMLACLKLPSNLKSFEVMGFSGDEMPRLWFKALSKLVSIKITDCENCTVLPIFSRLPHLQSLHLEVLETLEYVEDEDELCVSSCTGGKSYDECYYPLLENLELYNLPELKGWTRPSGEGAERHQLLFPRLLRMKVINCEKLISMPLAPKLESFEFRNVNETFKSTFTER